MHTRMNVHRHNEARDAHTHRLSMNQTLEEVAWSRSTLIQQHSSSIQALTHLCRLVATTEAS